MTPEQFHDYRRRAIAMHDEQAGMAQAVSLDAIFAALVIADAAIGRWKRAGDARKGDKPAMVDDDVRAILDAMKGQQVPLPHLMMRCGLWPTTPQRTRQFAQELRRGGFKSTRKAGDVVFQL